MFEIRAQWSRIAAALLMVLAVAACGGGGSDSGGGGGTTGADATPTPAAPGIPNGDPVTQTIDANGGSVTSTDGRLSVMIPPGALAAPTAITIQPITDTSPVGDAYASNYRLQPEGMTFAVPVTLTFHLEDYEVEAIDGMFVATQAADGFWDAQTGEIRDQTAKTVSVTTNHFSDWAILQTLSLAPRFDVVHTGAVRTFVLWATVCDPRPCRAVTVLTDAADGVCAAAAGSVAGINDKCIFGAPTSVPTPNPVIITARIASGPHVGIAVARAKITTQETWSGVWTIKDSGTDYNYIAWIQFNQIDSDLSVLDRHFEVDQLSHMSAAPPASIAPCSIYPLRTNTMSPGDGSLEVDYTASNDFPLVSTTGGKTFWPVTVSCDGQSYPASLGGVWLAPDQAFANKGVVTFTINMGTLTGTAVLFRNY